MVNKHQFNVSENQNHVEIKHTFLGSGVFKMDNDSAIQSTISSAASALLRQKTIASPISFLRGVNPRRISSNLSLCLKFQFQIFRTLSNIFFFIFINELCILYFRIEVTKNNLVLDWFY